MRLQNGLITALSLQWNGSCHIRYAASFPLAGCHWPGLPDYSWLGNVTIQYLSNTPLTLTLQGGRKNTHMTQSTNLGIFVTNEFILLFDFIQIYNLKLVSMKINRGRRNQLYLRSRYKKNIKSTLFLFPDILLLFYYERNLRIVSSIYL